MSFIWLTRHTCGCGFLSLPSSFSFFSLCLWHCYLIVSAEHAPSQSPAECLSASESPLSSCSEYRVQSENKQRKQFSKDSQSMCLLDMHILLPSNRDHDLPAGAAPASSLSFLSSLLACFGAGNAKNPARSWSACGAGTENGTASAGRVGRRSRKGKKEKRRSFTWWCNSIACHCVSLACILIGA